MTLVTVTYTAWDNNRKVVPASAQPRVGFRPLTTSTDSGLMTDREVWGTLDPVTGVGSVQLESVPGLIYQPFMDWLIDDGADEPTNRARETCEWAPFHPANGGPIDELPGVVPAFGAYYYGFGDPPIFLLIRNDVLYVDISGSADGFWQPWVPEGTLVEV
ncbi:hypothetical protein [Microbacterium sp. 4-7]|uniref:hypothetical protein n=1 Tax=Microbacterium sp. 4-7 TaxID=1885327 RepID=UPI00164F655D|nr:hypothetical protein [Microbacterium sp. 4-7]MBC6496116.1 hypothetical protein [Microbacterium sp. 4-7]